MSAFDNGKAVKTRKKRSDSHRSVFLWGATPVSLGKTKEMGWHVGLAGARPCYARRRFVVAEKMGVDLGKEVRYIGRWRVLRPGLDRGQTI